MSKITGISGRILIRERHSRLGISGRRAGGEELVLNLGEIVALPKDGRREERTSCAVGEGGRERQVALSFFPMPGFMSPSSSSSVRPSDFSSSSRYFAHEDETGNFVKMDCKRDCGCEMYEIFCFSDLDSVSCSISSPRVQALIASSDRRRRRRVLDGRP